MARELFGVVAHAVKSAKTARLEKATIFFISTSGLKRCSAYCLLMIFQFKCVEIENNNLIELNIIWMVLDVDTV